MSSAEQVLQLISSWIEQQELCEEQLRMLAGQLKNHRQSRLHRGVSFLKSALEGVGFMVLLLLTVVTLGAFFPVLDVTTEICTKKKKPKPAALFLKDRQNKEKRSTNITAEIRRLLEELKTDAKESGSCSEPDQVDQYVMTQVLTALARQSGLKGRIRISFSPGEPQIFRESTELIDGPAVMVTVAGILAFFTFQVSGQKLKPLFDEGLQQLIKQMSTAGCNAEQVDGATGMALKLQQATDTWTGMIQKNQVTKASQSLRDTADMMQRIIETLRQQFNDIKRTLDESARQHEEQPKELNKKKEEKTGNPKVIFIVTVLSKHSVNASQKAGAGGQTEGRQHEQSSQKNRDRGRNEETEQTGGHPGDTGGEWQGGDAGGQRSDSDEEDSDSDDSSDPSYQSSNSEDEDGEKIHLKMVSELSAPSIKMGLLNAHSINNKLPWLSKFIKKRDLMVLAITETFLKTIEQAQRLCKGLPDGIQVHQQPRNLEDSGKKSGGGVGIASSNELESTRVQLDKSFKSFEYVAANLRHKEWDRPIKTTTVYRRPGYDVIPFLEDFKEYLKNFFENDSILITGDFNIKVNDEKYKPATRFKELLNGFGLKQKVTKGTQKKGNILDLVITRNVEIADLSVEETDNQKLDHYAVIFNACPTSNDTPK